MRSAPGFLCFCVKLTLRQRTNAEPKRSMKTPDVGILVPKYLPGRDIAARVCKLAGVSAGV